MQSILNLSKLVSIIYLLGENVLLKRNKV